MISAKIVFLGVWPVLMEQVVIHADLALLLELALLVHVLIITGMI